MLFSAQIIMAKSLIKMHENGLFFGYLNLAKSGLNRHCELLKIVYKFVSYAGQNVQDFILQSFPFCPVLCRMLELEHSFPSSLRSLFQAVF